MIRIARPNDISFLIKLTKACAEYLKSCGVYQWNDQYPNIPVFKGDIKRNELYVLQFKEDIIGSICISTVMDDVYDDVEWIAPNLHNCYIHRLAIHPNYQSMGNAQLLMDFAEKKARQNEYQSIRLDTFSKNLRNQKFYELRGYKKLGTIYFPKQSEHPFYCYELLL